ncbi:MAG: HlyC/CorC family transporter [Ruminococcaceae bacterium]|nr:HlyC/CorC family transporter [Oscillospiraceae bacterium]
MIMQIAIMLFCIIMSAYFSATETAFSSLNKTRLKTMADKDNKRAELAYSLAEKYDKLISTILIGNNIVNILLASLGTVIFVHLMGDIGATVSTVVITVVVLIFGEITPKSIAKDQPEKFAIFSAPLINVLIVLLTPLNFLFSLWKKLVSKLFKVEENAKMSQEELLMLVEEVQQDGSIDNTEGDLLRNAIEFTDRRAEDIITHRVDLEAVSINDSKEEIARVFSATRFSRIPVYNETIDDIVGVIHQKDFYVDGKMIDGDIKDIMSPPVFIHKSEKISDLLKLLQVRKSHIAVVLDEYGGTFGIVTMEDILEELVGEIWDEHDEVVEDFKKISENEYTVDCAVNIEDLERFFDLEIESESVSFGGWIMEQLGKIAEVGDSFEYENIEVVVDAIDGHRVTFAKVTVHEIESDEDEETSSKDNSSKEGSSKEK